MTPNESDMPIDLSQPADLTVASEPEPETVIPVKETAAVVETPKPKTIEAPPQAKYVVRFDHVTKTFNAGTKAAYTAVKDVTFAVEDLHEKGEFIAILGPSGCGKSTVLRCIAGLAPHHPPTSGTVEVLGGPVIGPGSDRGMVFQDYTSFDHRTVLDNIAFGLECQGVSVKDRHEQARHWIKKVGLHVDRDVYKFPHELSGGMRQRVAIARSLILHPRLIMMDEPFGALDPATRLNMQDLLVELWRELQATVFFVTHSVEEAIYLGDRLYIFSSAPGTILQEMVIPPPDRPAKEMQREPWFTQQVFEVRDLVETLESGSRAGN